MSVVEAEGEKMQTIRYYISWSIIIVTFVAAALLVVSWGEDTYRWHNAKDLAHEQIENESQINGERNQTEYASKEKPVSVWKLFVAATFVIIAAPSISTIRIIGKNDSLEYITTPDEYCRQRIDAIDKKIDKEDRVEVLQSELESVYENNRIYKKKYVRCELELVVALVIVGITGTCIWLAFTRTGYDSLMTNTILGLFVTNCANVSRCVRNLAKNQFNQISMLLAVQTGSTPLKAELFINEVLITRYEDRIAYLKESERKIIRT